jgi:hypothetical protein
MVVPSLVTTEVSGSSTAAGWNDALLPVNFAFKSFER